MKHLRRLLASAALLLLPSALGAQHARSTGRDDTTPQTGVTSLQAPGPQNIPGDDLAAALADAYATNPELAARRYELRATDNDLGLALSQVRPSAQVQISGGYEYIEPGRRTNATRPLNDRLNDPAIERNDLGAQLIIDQPLSTGGKAKADIRAAGAQIRAGREALRGVEGDLLVEVIATYADVRQDSAALAIRENNLRILGETLDEVIARREAGELTRTDIAQAQTQLQAASVQLNAAHAQLQQSRASFVALVGREPGTLAPEPPLPLLPATIDEAFEVAERFNPEMAAAIHAERASRARIAAARAEGHPSLSLRGIAGATGPASPLHAYDEDVSLSARATLTIPLASGGRVSSLVGQALNRNSADRLGVEAARRTMVRAIVSAWNQMETARRNVEVQQVQLDAARIYYEGSFEEYRAGLRSTFDVLYAQNSLRETQVALLASKRDHYVAQAALLRQLGMLEAGKLLTGTALYDPSVHTRKVMNRSALPWDPAMRAIDQLGSPGEDQQIGISRQVISPADPEIPANKGRVELPARLPQAPRMAAPSSQPEHDLITHSPITPLLGTAGAPAATRKP